MINPFDGINTGFSLASMTEAVNKLPYLPQTIEKMGVFQVEPVTNINVTLEERSGQIHLLTSQPRDGRAVLNPVPKGSRRLVTFNIPHYPFDDFLYPQDIQGVRAFGDETMPEVVAQVINDKLATATAHHSVTREFLMMGALRGLILDGDGSILYDLHQTFGIPPKKVDFKLGTSTTKVREKCHDVKRFIKNALSGTETEVVCFCSPAFFDKLVSHDSVKEAYLSYQLAADRIGGDVRSGFQHGGIMFKEYDATVPGLDGNSRDFLGVNEATAFPVGVPNVFRTVVAPANKLETVNTRGRLIYAWSYPDSENRWIKIHTESNVLPICKRPDALVAVYTSN